MVSRPELDDMIVSATRHRKSIEDSDFTSQFRLRKIFYAGFMSLESVQKLNAVLEDRLHISLTDNSMSIVWCLVESGQVAVVNDYESLCAVVKDHQNASKHAIQLYIVNNSGKVMPVPRIQTANICLDITNFPKIFPK